MTGSSHDAYFFSTTFVIVAAVRNHLEVPSCPVAFVPLDSWAMVPGAGPGGCVSRLVRESLPLCGVDVVHAPLHCCVPLHGGGGQVVVRPPFWETRSPKLFGVSYARGLTAICRRLVEHLSCTDTRLHTVRTSTLLQLLEPNHNIMVLLVALECLLECFDDLASSAMPISHSCSRLG